MRTVDVFLYGLFMDAEALASRGATPTRLQPASVEDFQLRIGIRATLVPAASGRVFGMVATLTYADVDLLFANPTMRAYRPEAVLAQLATGELAPALCFNLVDPPAAGESNPEYAARLKGLAERLELPSDYVATIG